MEQILVHCKECGHKATVPYPGKGLKSFLCRECGAKIQSSADDFVIIKDSMEQKKWSTCNRFMPAGRTTSLCEFCSPKGTRKFDEPVGTREEFKGMRGKAWGNSRKNKII